MRVVVATLIALLACAGSAEAGSLTFAGSFIPPAFPTADPNNPNTDGAQGIAFDPASGHLFLVNEAGNGSTILELTTAGVEVSHFVIDPGQVSGLDSLPNGNLLAADGGSIERGLFEFTTAGAAVPGGIALDVSPVTADVKSAAFHPISGTIYVADDDVDAIRELEPNGAQIRAISTPGLDLNFQDPEGLTVNTRTGHLLIANDLGRRGLWELSTDGSLVAFYELGGPGGFQDPSGAALDPEGVAFDPDTGTVYVSFHENRAVGAYVLDSDGDGANDGADACPLSDPDPTVVIGACDSGVPNRGNPQGCKYSDIISACPDPALRPSRFVGCTQQWIRSAYLDGARRGFPPDSFSVAEGYHMLRCARETAFPSLR